jgi:hypothetical protein
MSIHHSHANNHAPPRWHSLISTLLLLALPCSIGVLYVQALQTDVPSERAQDAWQQFFLTHSADFWDERAYLENNPDVASAIENGDFDGTGWFHFLSFGHQEGREVYLISPDYAIRADAEKIFQQYLTQVTADTESEFDAILALMNWFSSIAIRCTSQTEQKLARLQRAPVRELPLNEVVYLLYNDRYAMLCGNYANFFSRILTSMGYPSIDYNTGYGNSTHVVSLVQMQDTACGQPCYTMWDSFYNYYISDNGGRPVCLHVLYQGLNDFYTNGTTPPFHLVFGNLEREKHLIDAHQGTQIFPYALGVPSDNHTSFYIGYADAKHNQYLQQRLPMFVHPKLGNLFPINLLPLPLESHNLEVVKHWLHQYPDLPHQVTDFLDRHHPDFFANHCDR